MDVVVFQTFSLSLSAGDTFQKPTKHDGHEKIHFGFQFDLTTNEPLELGI
jgi:hypothetical protein